jgi:hypothetical protein
MASAIGTDVRETAVWINQIRPGVLVCWGSAGISKDVEQNMEIPSCRLVLEQQRGLRMRLAAKQLRTNRALHTPVPDKVTLVQTIHISLLRPKCLSTS